MRNLRAARDLGISQKRLFGWEPVERTRVLEYDEQGRPVRWETTRDVEWDEQERALMLALGLFEAQMCRKCGMHLSQAMDPMNDPDLPEAPRRWVADGPDECFSCKALVRADREWSAAQDENVKNGGEDSSPWTVHTPLLKTKPVRVRH